MATADLDQESSLADYEFFELKVYDIHGHAKGRMVTRSRMLRVMKNGMGLHPAVCFYGVKGQPNFHPDLNDAVGFANATLMPLMDTLKPCQRSLYGGRKVASVVCELRKTDGTLNTVAPREVTLALLQRLESEFGLRIRSSCEMEFGICDSNTGKPLAHLNKWASVTAMQCGSNVLMGLFQAMQDIDLKLDSLLAEYGPGHFEVTFDVTEGIKAVDMAAEFKLSSFVYLKEQGYDIEFMTNAHPTTGCPNGFHLNFSLWNTNNENVLFNPNDQRQLSDVGKHFLAGLVEHAPAMLAFSSSTINCYRRIGTSFSPKYANWASEDRESTYRVKFEPGKNVYIENRLGGSACSPHLVLISTLAAGMDGIRRKLILPGPNDSSRKLPRTLEEALEALEADTILRESIGEEFVKMFVYAKRKFECDEFKAFSDLSAEERFKKEKEYYYDVL